VSKNIPHIKITPRQSIVNTCQEVSPPPYQPYIHLRMVKLPRYERNQRIVPSKFHAGDILKASYVHVGTGEILSSIIYAFTETTMLYFAASDRTVLSEWHYIVRWLDRDQCWDCSCLEGVKYKACRHSAEVDQYIKGMR